MFGHGFYFIFFYYECIIIFIYYISVYSSYIFLFGAILNYTFQI
jgi:hypothetical protein